MRKEIHSLWVKAISHVQAFNFWSLMFLSEKKAVYYLFVYITRSQCSLLGRSFVFCASREGKIPKYNKRRTVSADFHLHKFSYILVKIIAVQRRAPLSWVRGKKILGSTKTEERVGHWWTNNAVFETFCQLSWNLTVSENKLASSGVTAV